MIRNIFKHCRIKNTQISFGRPRIFRCKKENLLENSRNPNLTFARYFRTSSQICDKTFVHHENAYAHNLLPRISQYLPTSAQGNSVKIINSEDFNELMNRNWRQSSASEITQAFNSVVDFCCFQNIQLSDPRFDNLVDGLMDHCEKLTDSELLQILQCVAKLPPCDTTESHNYYDVWCCLDDICCWKMHNWPPEKLFAFAEVFFQLGLGKVCDFIFEVLDRLTRKVKNLTKDQLVYAFFYFNVCRKKPVAFEFEDAVAAKITEFSLDDLGIIAMGYFKSKSKIKLAPILTQMMIKVAENSQTVDPVTLSAILKVLRFSQHTMLPLTEDLTKMLDKLVPEIPRLSEICCLHIALVGTMIQYYHPESLAQSTQRIVENMEKIRLKEIERILLANAMFSFDPKTDPDLYKTAYDELHKQERCAEIVKYNRCLPAALSYLSMRQMYSYSFMNRILDDEFISEVYGNNPKNMPRELVSLDASIEIEFPDYQGNRLLPWRRYKGVKWLVDYAPTYDQHRKLNMSEKFFLNVQDCLEKLTEGNVMVDHVLPHFSRADMILCKDISTNAYIEPFGFQNYTLGDVKRPTLKDHLKWYAVITLVPNISVRNTSLPLGTTRMKERQLRAIGYTPVYVPWNEFGSLSENSKIEYLKQKLEFCEE